MIVDKDDVRIKILEAEAMMIPIAGTFICNYNGALTGEISDNIIGYPGNLTHSL